MSDFTISSGNQSLSNEAEYRAGFRWAIDGQKYLDTHVHDMPLCMGDFAIQGLPSAVGYHYVDGEAAQVARMSRAELEQFIRMPASTRAERSMEILEANGMLPMSTAHVGLYRMAEALGLNTSQPMVDILREWHGEYAEMSPGDYRQTVIDCSPVSGMVSTQSIFNPAEARLYLDDDVMENWDPFYQVGIRMDEALRNDAATREAANLAQFRNAGGSYADKSTHEALRAMVDFYANRFDQSGVRVRYISLSLGPEDRFYSKTGSPKQSQFAIIMREVVIPMAKKLRLPVFLMPYVRRGVNPAAGNSGDCVAQGPIDDLKKFVAEHHDVSFIVTGLHPTLNYDLCFLARSCPNVRVIGFWWGNLNSAYVQEQTEARFEMLGTGWTGLNSDARITDQILYKWDDWFDDLEEVLATRRLPALARAGITVTPEGIRKIVKAIQDPDALFHVQ